MRRRCLVVLCGFLVGGLGIASRGDAQSRPTVSGRLPFISGSGGGGSSTGRCAWPFLVDVDTVNVAYPDPNAHYWATPLTLAAGESLTVHGTYPSARFIAVTLYDAAGDTIAQISDLDIAPDPGSANPYAVADPPPGSGRSWQVTVIPSGGHTVASNVLELEAGQRAGWVVYRVYLGNGDPQGGEPLPTIVRKRGTSVSATLAPCSQFLPATAVTAAITKVLPDPIVVTEAPSFIHVDGNGLFANTANAYLEAVSDAPPGQILVVRGKLPTSPDTEAGQSVVGDFDMRYFSITSNLNEKPYPTVDGLFDHELPLDDAGFYTVVIARDDDVPADATAANGIGVLSWGDGTSQAVIVRNMLPSSGFDSAVQDVTPTTYGEPSDASEVMGDYYPRIVTCQKATFEALGAAGCFAGAP